MANLKVGNPKFGDAIKPMGLIATPAVSITRAAELSGSSVKSIQRAKAIVDCGIPELQEMVESGDVSVRAGNQVANA